MRAAFACASPRGSMSAPGPGCGVRIAPSGIGLRGSLQSGDTAVRRKPCTWKVRDENLQRIRKIRAAMIRTEADAEQFAHDFGDGPTTTKGDEKMEEHKQGFPRELFLRLADDELIVANDASTLVSSEEPTEIGCYQLVGTQRFRKVLKPV